MKTALLVVWGIVLTTAPLPASADTKPPRDEALELLLQQRQNDVPLRIQILFENGSYNASYFSATAPADAYCFETKNITLPVGRETEIIVTSSDEIIEWAVATVKLNVIAIPGRLESERVLPKIPGRQEATAPDTNGGKFADIPLHVLPEKEFDTWFQNRKPCPN